MTKLKSKENQHPLVADYSTFSSMEIDGDFGTKMIAWLQFYTKEVPVSINASFCLHMQSLAETYCS